MKAQGCLFEPVPSSVSLSSSGAAGTREPEQKRHGLRETSVAQFAVAVDEGLVDGREAEALALLERCDEPPTAGEMGRQWLTNLGNVLPSLMEIKGARLHLARALSGLRVKQLVEAVPSGKRECQVTGVRVETWRIRQVGGR